jgi:hypothetical protein
MIIVVLFSVGKSPFLGLQGQSLHVILGIGPSEAIAEGSRERRQRAFSPTLRILVAHLSPALS